MLSVVPLNDLSVYSSTNTGEKPQSKLWTHADQWWTVMPDNSGTWISRLDGESWTPLLQVSSNSNVNADVKADGDLAHILLFDGSNSQLASVEYVSASNSYDFWNLQPNLVDMGLPSGIETATIDIDSQGRMWVAYDQSNSVEVRYSDGLYTNWSGPVTVASNINSDDISVVTALPNDSIGVMWSNQSSERFGFRFHVDGTSPGQWSSDEVPASQSALNIGGGMADDHLNVAVASDGTLYAAVKTSYDSSGASKIALLVRRPSGTWDNLYHVDSIGTRPIVILNEAAGRLIVAYTESDSGGDIRYRETALNAISFGSRQILISGSVNNPTSTKQNFTDDVVVLASGGSNASGALFSFGQVIINQPPQVNAGSNQTIALGSAAVLSGVVSDDGLPSSPGTMTTSWTVTSGPGNVSFGNGSSASTTAQFSAAGSYVLRLTANDGQLSAFDEATITVADSSTPVTIAFQDGLFPLVSYRGTRDTNIFANNPTTNYGSVQALEVDGSPDQGSLLGWDVSAIPTGSIVTSAMLELNITNSTPHSYEVYALQRAWDELSATWEQAAAGTPWSTSGASGAADHGATVLGQLAASSTGAYQLALNAAGLAAVQSWVTDSSTNHGLVFQDYVNSTNGIDFSSREASNAAQRPKLVVTYEQLGGNTINEAPQVNAGSNQTITLGSAAVLSGVVSDDGLPSSPGTMTTSWTVTSGPGSVTFGNGSSTSTTAQFSAAGSYVLRLTANDGQMAAFDQVNVVVNQQPSNLPPPVNVGALTQYTVMYGHNDDPGATDAFRQNVVPTFNVIEGTSSDASFINELRGQGKVYAAHVLNPTGETAAQLLARWRAPFDNTLGGQLPGGYDGIAIDELSGVSTDGTASSNAVVSALSQLRALYPNKHIFAATTYHFGYSSANYSDQLNALNQYADLIMVENYLREDLYSYRFFDVWADNLKAVVPGILNKTVYGLHISQGGLVADSSTDIGYWGFLDDQLHRIRNDADASTMPGVMFWVYYRSEKDLTPEFVSKLVDHYYVQNNTSFFGDGGMEQLIGNPQFEGNTSGWTLSPGAGGSVGTFNYSSVSIQNGHDDFGQTSHGTSGLRMIRGTTPNEASFQVSGLDPNLVYTVSAFVNSESSWQQATLAITELDGTLIAREIATNVGSPRDFIDKWNEWTRLDFNFVPTASSINVVLSDETAAVGTTLYWDFIELESAFPNTAPLNELPSVGTGLVGHWTLDSISSGTATDSSGFANEGIVQGNPQTVVGPSGNALQFNGSSDYIQVNDDPTLDFSDQITIAAWIRPETNGTQYAIKKAQFGSTDGFELSLSSNGHFFVRFNEATGGNAHRLDSAATYPTDGNTWVHVVATYDGATIRMYVNGVLDASKNSQFNIGANNLALGIGAQDDGIQPLTGSLDDVRIYNRALSNVEVQALYL